MAYYTPLNLGIRDKLYKQLKTTQVDTPEYLRLKTNLDNYNKVLKQSIHSFDVASTAWGCKSPM